MDMPEDCVICKRPIDKEPSSTLGEKGSASVNRAGQARNDSIHCVSGQKVHQVCRQNYFNPQRIAGDANRQERPNVVQRVKAMNFVPETIHSSLVRTVSSVGSQAISGIVREKPTCH